MQNDMHTPSIVQSLGAGRYQIQETLESVLGTASTSSSGQSTTADLTRKMYFSRLLRICGVDEEGAERLAKETPYCLADLAYADVRFVWKWCMKLGIQIDKPVKRIVDAAEMMRIEKILMDARRYNRSYVTKKMKRQQE